MNDTADKPTLDSFFSVAGKTILITGASRGIGKTMALAFRDLGATVYGTGSRPESIEWASSEGIEGRAADIGEAGAMEPIIAEVIKKHGRLDCLINNAGVAANTPASGFKDADMDRMIDINFKGVFRTCQAYYKAQRKQGGNIINVSSVLGSIAVKLASVYCGTKGAVNQLTRALAIEWANNNFRVNAICPGFVDTDMTEMIKRKPEVLKAMEATVPLQRLGKPMDMMGAALFLAGDGSAYVTGHLLTVDGGFTVG